jgi:PAS domain S-box-containing protein
MTHSSSDRSSQSESEGGANRLAFLFERGARSATVLDALPDPVFLCKPDGKVVYWNRRAQEVARFSEGRQAKMNLTEVVPKSLRSTVQDKLDEAVETGSTRLEVPVLTPDGHTVPFEVTGSLVTRGGNALICGIARDISERKARQEELRRQKEKWRLLVNQVEEYAIFMLDREGVVTTWNEGAKKIKGYAEEDIVGQHFSVFYPEEDVEAGKTEEALAVAAQDGQWVDEGWRVRKDGSRFWALVMIKALHEENGRLRGFAKVTRDMTERRKREEQLRKSERRYRRLFEDSRDAIFLTTPEGDIVDVNGAAEDLFGYSRKELLDLDASALYAHPEERERRIVPGLMNADTQRFFEARMAHKDGHTFLASASVTVHRDEDGEPQLIQALVRDVTEQRELQRDVLRAQEEERRAIGQDLHDGVAAQLTGLHLLLDTAKEMLDEDHPAYQHIMRAKDISKESGEHVRQLSRGLTPMHLTNTELPSALDQLAQNTDACVFEQEGSLPSLSDEQKTQLYWIAQEAVTNARKYADADEIRIRLSTTDDGVRLVVEDDGKGFDPAAEGGGLGLRSMKYRSDLLGGRFSLDSAPGEGTRIECKVYPPMY